jgi:hypothetical protein
VVDLFASRGLGKALGARLGRSTSAFVGIENAFDATYDVGRTPILTTGLPRTARAGILLMLP